MPFHLFLSFSVVFASFQVMHSNLFKVQNTDITNTLGEAIDAQNKATERVSKKNPNTLLRNIHRVPLSPRAFLVFLAYDVLAGLV